MDARTGWLGLALAGLLAAGCGTDGGNGGGNGNGGGDVTADNGALRVREATCDYVVRCQLAPLDASTCQAALAAQAGAFDSPDALFAAVRAGKASLDAGRLSQCLEQLRNLPCESSLDTLAARSGCDQAFTGRVPAGGRCVAQGSCVLGTRCDENAGSATDCAGACVALAAGECADARDCPAGQTCDFGACAAPAAAGAAGQPCGTGDSCQGGLVCDTGTCLPLPGANQPCAPGGTCAGAGLACVPSADLSSATCLPSKPQGAPCTLPFECGGLLSGLVCDLGATDRCIARPKLGPCVQGACDFTSAWCDGSVPTAPVCRPFLAAGSPCVDAVQCGSPFGDADCADDGTGALRCVASSAAACAP